MHATTAGPRSQKTGASHPADRRSHRRHQVQALGVTVMFRGCDAPAGLIDISLGGMAVLYIPAGPGLPDAVVCDLIAVGSESALARALVCRTVYDIAELTEGRSFRGSATRRRGFRFSRLKEEQKHEVEHLISRSGASP
jgi:hypothetical protein